MNDFSLGNAWSKGVSFFSPQALNHAIILIGIGVLAPLVLQLALAGGASGGLLNPSMMGQGGLNAFATMGGVMLIVVLVSYVLQTGSYFASWRIGFGEGESPAGAIIFGLILGVVFIVGLILIGVVAGLLAQAAPIVALLFALIVLLPLFAAIYTVLAAVAAIMLLFVLLLLGAFGANLAQTNPGFAMMGGGGIVLLISFIILALMLWLAARFSCVGPIMADRKTFNIMAAITESWRLTASNQWKIVGYLALLGVVLMVLLFLVGMIMGAGMMNSMQSGGVPEAGIGTALMGLIISIPFAYLMVLVPAGIYRELVGTETSAKVFA